MIAEPAADEQVQGLPWFHGFISFAEAAQLLKGRAKGTYLARFSHSHQKAIVLAYVSDGGGDVKQSLVHPQAGKGYRLGNKVYPTISAIIASHGLKLRAPLHSTAGAAVEDSPYAFDPVQSQKMGVTVAPSSDSSHPNNLIFDPRCDPRCDEYNLMPTQSAHGREGDKQASIFNLASLNVEDRGSAGRPVAQKEALSQGETIELARRAQLAEENKKLSAYNESEKRANFPDEFLCPITREVMVTPVIACDGHSYEQTAIHQWFAENSQSPRSPMTNQAMPSQALIPNLALRKLIQDRTQ